LIYADAIRLQKDVAKKVIVAKDDFGEISHICGVDIAYSANSDAAYCSAVIMDRNTQQLIYRYTNDCEVSLRARTIDAKGG
jgi:deoxyinosine 3'endonuclease (endonuclease V)